MHDAIKQIGERLRGLRDVLDIPAEDVAQLCDLDIDTYMRMEAGDGELSISNLQKISNYIFIITPACVDISGDFQEIVSGTFNVPPISHNVI